MTLKKGDSVSCPHCGEDSVVTIKTEMDGWTKVGEFPACAMCGARLGDMDEDIADNDSSADNSSAAALMDFLSTDAAEKDEVIDDDGSRRFCRDCKHLLEHPFKVYCLLHKKDVNPMDDCDKFIPRQSETS